MLDSREFTFTAYQDSRTQQHEGFVTGLSGPLLLAVHNKTGEKYIVKHTYGHNAANEYVACWLADKIGVPAPKVFLLSRSNLFTTKYAVAISFIEGIQAVKTSELSSEQVDDVVKQFAFNSLTIPDDKVQMSAAGNHVYSYDFSERFCVEDEGLLRAFQFDEETGINAAKATLQEFKRHLQYVTFDLPGVAAEYGIDPEKQKADMIATAKQVLTITESEIRSLSDELIEMYPVGYGVYYEECIRLIQKYVSRLA